MKVGKNMVSYKELKRVNDKLTTADKDRIQKIIELVLIMSITSRQYGLLDMEELINKLSINDIGKKGINLVVDGTDPALVESLLVNKYYANGYEGIEAMENLLLIVGILEVQKGTTPRLLLKLLTSMVSHKIKLDDEFNTVNYYGSDDLVERIRKQIKAEHDEEDRKRQEKFANAKKLVDENEELSIMNLRDLSNKPDKGLNGMPTADEIDKLLGID